MFKYPTRTLLVNHFCKKKEIMSKEYKWSETKESIRIELRIKNVSLKKIDILLTDVFIKINAPSIKFIQIFDLLHPIDYNNARNKIQLKDTHLELLLYKEEPILWEQLILKEKKEILIKRREEATARYTENMNKIEEEKKKLRIGKFISLIS
jgi:hypothetical protein